MKLTTKLFLWLQKDVFDIPAVDLGQLTKVKVTHDGSGSGSGWLLDKIVVKEKEDSNSQYVFECGRWLDEGSGENDVEVTLPLTDVIETAPQQQEVDDKEYKSKSVAFVENSILPR
jgi:hypothetical protein